MTPTAIKGPCGHKGCPRRSTRQGYCDEHRKAVHKRIDANRGTPTQRGYGNDWRKMRAYHLRNNPLCVACKARGITEVASVVDHIVPHKGDEALRTDPDNLQSLCKRCHDSKTANENRGTEGRIA